MVTQTETTYQPRFTSGDLSAIITERIKELAEATNSALVSEAMLKYLDMTSRFHHYSAGNVWLILMEKPEATLVAGFRKWKSMKRFVRRGERGIAILAPVLVIAANPRGEDEERLVGFKTAHVFDVSQTEGEPLPEPPNWKSPEQNAVLSARLVKFAQSMGISVTVKKQAGDTQGVSRGNAIEIDPSSGTKTLIHEIAHSTMHFDADRPDDPTIRELEAESVAYVVGKHFGLEGLSSPSYICLHRATAELIMTHLERIRKTAAEIITAIESDPCPTVEF